MRKTRGFLLAGGLLVLALGQSGYIQLILDDSTVVRWRDFPIRFQLWNGLGTAVQGNAKVIILEALERWSRVSSLAITTTDTNVSEVGEDGVNLVTMADTPNNLNALPKNPLGRALITFQSTGRILEADVIFHPRENWKSTESNLFEDRNLMDTAEHEFGHSFNLGHAIQRSSIMYFQVGAFAPDFNILSWDDISGINATDGYQLVGLDQITGEITGTVTRSGQPVRGGFVLAADSKGMLMGGAPTDRDGSFRIRFLPAGNYTVYVEPLDGPTLPENITSPRYLPPTTDFLPRFHQDSAAPNVPVPGNPIQIQVQPGNTPLDPDRVGAGTGSIPLTTIHANIPKGVQNTRLAVRGKGVDKLPGVNQSGGLSFLGSFFTVGTVSLATPPPPDHTRAYRLSVSPDTEPGTYSFFLNAGADFGVLGGGARVYDPLRFLQAFAQYAHVPGSVSSQIFMVNTSTTGTAAGELLAYSSNPTRHNLGALNIPAGGATVVDSSGNQLVGSLRARADRSIGGTVLFQTGFGTTGVGASPPLYSFIAPVEIAGGGSTNTAVAITNLDSRDARIFIGIQNKAGSPVISKVEPLEGNGQLSKFIPELFHSLPADFRGTAVVTANRTVAATVIRTSPNVLTTFPVIQNRVRGRSFYAQFANTPDISSELLLVNPSPTVAANQVVVQIRTSNGANASNVRLSDGQVLANGQITLQIPPLGCATIRTGGNDVLVGSVEVTSAVPVGGVVLFRSSAIGTTGVGESFALRKAVIPISRRTGSGIDTGVALVNTNAGNRVIRATVRNGGGSIVAGPKNIGLTANQQFAVFPNEAPLSLNLPADFTGSLWIEVEGEGEIAATVIRTSPGVLTTFPAISLDTGVIPAP